MFIRLPVLFCLLAACAPAENEPNARLMEAIEARVKLPAGSEPLQRYSRYYAPGEGGNVEVLFTIHGPNTFKDFERFCDEGTVKTFPCSAEGKSDLAPAGSRKWLGDARHLPVSHGGSCGVIRFTYDPTTGEISAMECNGEY